MPFAVILYLSVFYVHEYIQMQSENSVCLQLIDMMRTQNTTYNFGQFQTKMREKFIHKIYYEQI